MDPHASRNVGNAVLISTLLGVAYGASYGLINRSSALLFAFTSGTSVLLSTSLFFGVREYAVSPFLLASIPSGQFARRREQIAHAHVDGPDPKGGWTEMRMYKVPDSAAAGALTGGALNTLRRGRAGIIPGAITFAIAASLLQLGINEASISRIKLVARELSTSPPPPSPSSPSTSSAPTRPAVGRPAKGFSEYVLDTLSYVMPVKKLNDAEFVRVTEKRREAIDERLRNIDKELVDLEQADERDGVSSTVR